MPVSIVKHQWICTLLFMIFIAIYQLVDVVKKVHTLGRLRPVLRPDTVKYSYIGDDIPNYFPLRVKSTSINVEWLDARVYGIYADDDWSSNFPIESGFVNLGPNDDRFSVSMYHQLHCLDALRYGYASAKAGVLEFPGNGTEVQEHVNHCLVYLREMILCAADTTLEPGNVVRIDKYGKKEIGSTGANVIHRCRDWTQVREAMDANTAEYVARLQKDK